MLKKFLAVATLALLVTLTAVASDREDDVKRSHKAAEVFRDIMNAPDQGIPHDSAGIGEMHRHYSGRGEVRFYIRRQLWPGTGNLPHGAWLERADVSGH
jgi:hypothetical protein